MDSLDEKLGPVMEIDELVSVKDRMCCRIVPLNSSVLIDVDR